MPIALINAQARPFLDGGLPDAIEPIWWESEEQLLALAPQAEIAWLDKIPPAVAARAIERMHGLRWYNAMSSGVDWLPLDTFRMRNVMLTNGAGIHAQSVTEFAVMGMLDICKGWREIVRARDRHEWLRDPPGTRELLDSEVLVIGAGEIGQRIRTVLEALGARVTVARRRAGEGELGPQEWRGALGRFDWVVLIVPSTPETTGMLGAAEMAAMKHGACLVNLARGSVIDQDALLAAIDAGHLGGAYLDVTSPEPLPPEHPLWSRPNVHISMHLAGLSQKGLFPRGAARFVANLKRYLAREPLEYRVDLSRGY